jgi:DNA-binding IclR family transcriptional regulator
MPRPSTRSDQDYEIEAASKVLRVLEAVEGERGEPVSFKRIIDRTGFSRDFVLRALKTLKINGYVMQTRGNHWAFAQRLLKLTENYSELCLRALATGKS